MDCSICFEEFDDEDRRPVTGYCGHSLCQKCSRRLEDRSCPSCKREFAFAGEAISFQMLELLDVCKEKEERYTAALNDKEALKANITEMEHDNLGMILALGSEKDKAKDSKKETKQLKKQLAVAMKEANEWQKLAEEAERKAQEALEKLDEMKAQGQVDAPIEQQCEGGAEDGQAPGSGHGGQRSRRKRSANGRYVKNKMMKKVGSKSRRNDELGSRRPTSSQGSTLNRNPVSNSTRASSPKTSAKKQKAPAKATNRVQADKKHTMKTHVLAKHSLDKHICGSCDGAYAWKSNLTRHRRNRRSACFDPRLASPVSTDV